MVDVFISYKRRMKPRVAFLAEQLEAKGYSVWYDDDLRPGEIFADEINKHANEAKAVIVCWTPDCFAIGGDKKGWVRGEASAARDRGALVPVYLEKCKLDIPFNTDHVEDLSEWEGEESLAFKKILERLSALSKQKPMPVQTFMSPPKFLLKPILLKVGAAFVLAVASYQAYDAYRDYSHEAKIKDELIRVKQEEELKAKQKKLEQEWANSLENNQILVSELEAASLKLNENAIKQAEEIKVVENARKLNEAKNDSVKDKQLAEEISVVKKKEQINLAIIAKNQKEIESLKADSRKKDLEFAQQANEISKNQANARILKQGATTAPREPINDISKTARINNQAVPAIRQDQIVDISKTARVVMPTALAAPTHIIQVGSANTEEEAKLKAKLVTTKFNSFKNESLTISKVDVNGKTLFRVRSKPYTKEKAGELCAHLNKEGGICFVTAL